MKKVLILLAVLGINGCSESVPECNNKEILNNLKSILVKNLLNEEVREKVKLGFTNTEMTLKDNKTQFTQCITRMYMDDSAVTNEKADLTPTTEIFYTIELRDKRYEGTATANDGKPYILKFHSWRLIRQ